MRLNIDTFHVLNTILQEGSFAKASIKLHRAQSAISYQIKKLEDHLGTKIFDRSQYRATLTPVGQALWTEGCKMLELAHRIEGLAERYSEGWEPRLELVIDGSLPLAPVMRALKKMMGKDIPTIIQVKTEFLGGVQMHFERDKSDMMLVKEYKPAPNLIALQLNPVAVVLVAAKDHELSSMAEVSLNQLYDYVELTIHDTSDPDKETLDSLEFGGDRVFYLSDFMSKKEALLMGLGYGWMPEVLISKELQAGDLVQLNYSGSSYQSFTPHLVYPSDRPLGKAGTMIKDLIISELSSTMK
ncbi:LysR family transcriptional regulator [Dasania sp. GY-MA-18]|uniref:LysR family transcriptional regulator n=1 Tax=Dasania phycosphaerae TaxID=2950436 RepID=A0A9J6RL33_9GAMM|nr:MULTISPECIES: LysR family transcriptional regulator [Dasania]MCR8922611.1 LysR family transcriptional regulator [Dasania sp. GY-MA-18]MCZ0865041.1 LysR family transcriptional regulator [Dasania phycosphaerae]MCZ0868767.1 LysR family transcriptional regulator [Dasania phycosphaerae]